MTTFATQSALCVFLALAIWGTLFLALNWITKQDPCKACKILAAIIIPLCYLSTVRSLIYIIFGR